MAAASGDSVCAATIFGETMHEHSGFRFEFSIIEVNGNPNPKALYSEPLFYTKMFCSCITDSICAFERHGFQAMILKIFGASLVADLG